MDHSRRPGDGASFPRVRWVAAAEGATLSRLIAEPTLEGVICDGRPVLPAKLEEEQHTITLRCLENRTLF